MGPDLQKFKVHASSLEKQEKLRLTGILTKIMIWKMRKKNLGKMNVNLT